MPDIFDTLTYDPKTKKASAVAALAAKSTPHGDIFDQIEPSYQISKKFPNRLQNGLSEFFTQNLPKSAGQFAGNVAETVMHPIQTAKTLGNTALGVVEKTSPVMNILKRARLVPQKFKQEKYADALGKFFMDRYGGLDKATQTAYKDPVGFAADVSMALGGVGGMASKAGEVSKIGALEKAGEAVKAAGEMVDPMRVPEKIAKIGGMGDKTANWLKNSSIKSYTKALGPTTKTEKELAAKVAPELTERKPFGLSRGNLQSKAESELIKAGDALDDGYKNLPKNSKASVQGILDSILDKQKKLKINGVLPESNRAHFEQLDKIGMDLIEVAKDPDISPQTLREYRQVLDKAIADSKQGFVMTGRGGPKRYAQRFVANSIRRELASKFPSIAKLNKEFSFWSNMTDLLETTVPKEKSTLSSVRGFAGDVAGAAHPFGGIMVNLGKLINDNVAWNTFSGAQKARLSELISKGNFEMANRLINSARVTGMTSKAVSSGV